MNMIKPALLSIAIAAAVASALPAGADTAGEPGRGSGKANPLKNVYFGEQHLHTTNSPDAFVVGTRQT